MKVICVTTEYNHYSSCPIKVGEIYEIEDYSRTWEDEYKMIGVRIDSETMMEFVKKSFIPLSEYRENQIDKII